LSSYYCFCRRKSKHGSQVFGSAGDDEMRVCIPKTREKRKVEEIGPYWIHSSTRLSMES
jgi:hypothetical protein